MQEWKIRSKIYNDLNVDKKHRDDLNEVDIVLTKNVVRDAVKHFNKRVDSWIYPSKSYFVAICYANWIVEDFGGFFYDILNDPDLLPGDPFFVPYQQDKETYDKILKKVKFYDNKGMVPDVYEYYREEILESV